MIEIDEVSQQLGALLKGQKNIEARMAEVEKELRCINATVNQARGSWRGVVVIAGLVAGIVSYAQAKFWG